jgi:alkylhydroperoxidase/carboxymuconolactone decarboxylase family protein YurZ
MSTDIKKATDVLFDVGLKHRREVLGAEYVDKSIESANDFMMAFQHITTEWCWGYGWSREGLPRKTRSLLNLAMLTALNRGPEIRLHVRGAINKWRDGGGDQGNASACHNLLRHSGRARCFQGRQRGLEGNGQGFGDATK